MDTPAPLVNVSPTKYSFWQKLESWFHKEAVVIETDLKKLLSTTEVQQLEAGFTALVKTDLGHLATEAVTAAMDMQSGKVNFSAAASTLISSAETLGKKVTDSTVTTLIAAAQQKLQSTFGVTTSSAV